MGTLTFKVTLNAGRGQQVSMNIIGTNLNIDYGDGTTTTQEPNTTGIEEQHSFSNSNGSTEKTWTVTVTGNITGLGNQFLNSGGYAITEITLPEGLQTIDTRCLTGVGGEEIIIPSTVTSIGSYFLYTSSVKKVIFLTRNLTTIGGSFLYNNSQIKTIKLPEGLLSLDGQYSFNGCTGLKTLEVPSTFQGFPNPAVAFKNVQLETLRFNNGPISNPPINENTKIIVPLNRLQDFINHSSYPNDESRYDYYGTNISSAVYVSGKHMADKLMERGVTASADDGLTTLANKILQIPGIPNHQEIVSLRFNDDNNIKGSRPEQVPFKLSTNGELVAGCLLPMDKNGPTTHILGYPDGVRYIVEVPDKDQNNNSLTYEWETYPVPEGYVLQKPELNDNTFMFNGLFEHRIRLNITDIDGMALDSSDIVSISVKMNADYSPDGTEKTLTKSDFTISGEYIFTSVEGFAYQSFKQLWTNVTIELDLTKYITPISQSLSVTKQSNGDTLASKTIIAQPALPKDTYIKSNMRGQGQSARMFYGYLSDENDNPVEDKTITISYDDFGGGSLTATTGKCGFFSASQGGQSGLGVNTVTVTISFDGDSKYNGCTKTMTISTMDDINLMKKSTIRGGVDNDTLTIKISCVDTENLTSIIIDEWTVELYDEQDQYITSLTESNNTYTAPSTPCTIKAVYDGNCEELYSSAEKTFTIGE